MSATIARVESAAPAIVGPVGVLRRKCDCAGSDHECEECKKKNLLQRHAIGQGGPERAPPIVHDVLRSPGRALDQSTRAFMEARFGHDFGRVRVHADARAAASARLVHAKGYTVGHDIVMGAGQPSPETVEGRTLLAHELTHTIQQTGSDGGAAPDQLQVGPQDDCTEREADAVAAKVASGAPASRTRRVGGGHRLQRIVNVTPEAATSEILYHFNGLCPGQFRSSGNQIEPTRRGCSTSSTTSCECGCDTATDTGRTYTIKVQPASGTSKPKTLYDRSTAVVPESDMHPSTSRGTHPTINMVASAGSNVEFGSFSATGGPIWYDNWRILAHELCGHARLDQSYSGNQGCRSGHDVTIDTENAIAKEHGGKARGHFADPRQGEVFWNPVGDHSKVAFYQCNGLHYEKP